MNDYRLLKKRDGQLWKNCGTFYSKNFEEAKKEFAETIFNDLLNGVHGDNYCYLTVEEDGVEEDGIYYNGELEFSNTDLENGVDGYSNDVYRWKLQNFYNVKIDLKNEDSLFADNENEAIIEAKECYDTDNVILISKG